MSKGILDFLLVLNSSSYIWGINYHTDDCLAQKPPLFIVDFLLVQAFKLYSYSYLSKKNLRVLHT